MHAIHTQSTAHFLIVKRTLFVALFAFAAPLHAENISYTYDNLNRVIRSDNGNGTVIEYSYDAAGNRLSRTVSANQPPVANAGVDQTVNSGVNVSLNGGGSNDPDHWPSPITYSWSQTSGPSVTLVNANSATPGFTPLVAGTYVFQLIVNDALTASTADTVKITVNNANQPPIANAGADQTVNTGVKVSLNGSGSNDPDHGPTAITYSWSQTSGPSATLANATTAMPSFTSSVAGTYVFQLIVNDGLTASTADTVTITVNITNQAPVANAGVDQTVNTKVKVALDGSGSRDTDHGPSAITYRWTQTSGQSVTLANAATATPDFTPLVKGTYVFQLIVNDGLTASAPDTVTITVNVANQPPIANAGADQTVNTKVKVALDGSGSRDADHGPSAITYSWSQTGGPSVTLANSATATPSFTPLATGTYVFQLIVNDGLTASAADTVTIIVTDANTECLFNWAEKNYPSLFAPSGSPTAISSNYTYRNYSATNTHLRVSTIDTHVYYMGADGKLLDEGALSDWLPKAGCQPPPPSDCLFNWAENNYPGLFAPSGSATATWGVYTYRYYWLTNAHLGVSSTDNHVYYMGADGNLLDEGPLSYWLPKAGCQ